MKLMRLPRSHVEERARERGYPISEIQGCFISNEGDGWWMVDVEHPQYPRERVIAMPKWDGAKPGTELASIIAFMGIKPSKGCDCQKRADMMDSWGADGCELNQGVITGWLMSEARRRGVPLPEFMAKRIVRTAIARSRKARDAANG